MFVRFFVWLVAISFLVGFAYARCSFFFFFSYFLFLKLSVPMLSFFFLHLDGSFLSFVLYSRGSSVLLCFMLLSLSGVD